jgi:hypothetical protein
VTQSPLGLDSVNDRGFNIDEVFAVLVEDGNGSVHHSFTRFGTVAAAADHEEP